MRERLDVVNPKELRKAFTSIFSVLQRGKALEKYVFLEGKYLLLSDGTGDFSSGTICCKNCCVKKHKDGRKTYYHQALGAVIAHPDFKEEHPHLPVILAEDALAANGPHLKLLHELKISYITVVKPKGNKSLFEWLSGIEREKITFTDEEGKKHKLEFVNKVPLNDSHHDFEVNFLEYWVTDKKGKTYHNTWVTDIEITKKNAFQIVRGGRARWKALVS